MIQSRVSSVVLLIALTVSAVLVLTGCATPSDESTGSVPEGAEDGVANESENSSVSDDVFIENDTESEIGDMI
jgi:major membrane immunogen (membrane-anchored lipoprotein)